MYGKQAHTLGALAFLNSAFEKARELFFFWGGGALITPIRKSMKELSKPPFFNAMIQGKISKLSEILKFS